METECTQSNIKVNKTPATYSSIVKIGEMVSNKEKETNQEYLKLHRGVMDVTTIDLNTIVSKIDFNSKKMQQYGGNDGDSTLINTIKENFHLNEHHLLIVPGGMASLDLTINSLDETEFWVPKYHWGSWNKILKTHNKNINTFDDFKIEDFKPESGVVMLCYPSNPTGFSPTLENLKIFLDYTKERGITTILDLPYYYLFNPNHSKIYDLFHDNVIVVSSFSKSIGLSGFRVGYIATKSKELYEDMRIRSLYKYNSISTPAQFIINELFTTNVGKTQVDNYKWETYHNIKLNIEWLKLSGLLFEEYGNNTPIGPFAIVNKSFEELLEHKISSVPLSKFCLENVNNNYSRISVAVPHKKFVTYFNNVIKPS